MPRKSAREDPAPYGKPARASALVDTRVIYCGDNLEQLKKLPDACVDLIYIDPPFNSNRNYEVFWGETKEKRSFEDRHASTQAYIDFMRPRCVELARVLKKKGSFYYHCDWHASHYVKVMLDGIFGENTFCNEIIWKRQSTHSDAKLKYPAVTDSILFYCADNKKFNVLYTEYDPEYVANFYKFDDGDGKGRYRLSDMSAPLGGGMAAIRKDTGRPNGWYVWKGYQPPERGWRYSPETMKELDAEGRIFYPKDKDGNPSYDKRLALKRYFNNAKGQIVSNLWDDIQSLSKMAAEYLNYPTQKPLALLERIIKASSNENDIVLDAFCGCGTALVAAQNLKRQWIGIDISPTSCRVMAKSLRDHTTLKEDEALWKIGRGFVVRDLPWTEEKLRTIPPFEFENWAVIAIGGIPNKAQVGDSGIDGRIYPVSAIPSKQATKGELFNTVGECYPIQVKQKDKAGRPEIQNFCGVMTNRDLKKGFFVSFDFSHEAMVEVGEFFKKTGKIIILLTVKEILEEQLAMKLA